MNTEDEHPLVTRTRKLVDLCRDDWDTIRKLAGVSESWLYKFTSGNMKNPTIGTLQSVTDACERILARPRKRAA